MTALTVHTNPPKEPMPIGFGELLRLATALVPTGFLPDHIKNPAQAVAIILAGREMGIGPMQALRSIVMVKGKITVAADLQLALFKGAGGRAEFKELSEKRAVLHLTHPNGDKHVEEFTLDDAGKAGLLSNANWKNYPKAMLRSRVITAGLKSVGFEPCAGAYDPEELGTVSPGPGESKITEEPVTLESASRADPPPPSTVRPEDEWSHWPFGKYRGTAVSDLPTEFVKWACGEGRTFGTQTEEWQQVLRAEMNRRHHDADAPVEAGA